ncbi:MAG: ribose transport system permease protein [Thermomicrobiales bacterium]|jgi:ribose transport system permease protein|nr:ribose transport system permease protein [Thermomicrobiales bacterium]
MSAMAGVAGRRLVLPSAEWAWLAGIVGLECVVLAVLEPNFLTEFNFYVLLRGVAVTLIVAFAQLVVLAVGQLNLSVGAIGGMVAVCTGGMMEVWHVPTPAAIALGLLLGMAAGFANGMLTTRTGINGFIITLATASTFSGITIGLNDAKPFYNLPQGYVDFGQARTGAFPHIGIVTLAVAAALALLLTRFLLGRQILAVGGNARAASLSGIPVNRIVVVVHVLSGLLAAIAALLLMARLGSAQPSIGSDWLLASFAIPIVGGIALTGGSASVVNAVLAAFLIALIDNGLVLTKADPYWIQFLLGAIILGAVGLNRLRVGAGGWGLGGRGSPREEQI